MERGGEGWRGVERGGEGWDTGVGFFFSRLLENLHVLYNFQAGVCIKQVGNEGHV